MNRKRPNFALYGNVLSKAALPIMGISLCRSPSAGLMIGAHHRRAIMQSTNELAMEQGSALKKEVMMAQESSMLLLPEWSAQVTTKSGTPLNIRSATSDDRDAVLVFLQAVDPPDLRFRFLSAVKPSDALARILTDVDHRATEDLLAFDARDGSIAATAMIAQGESPDCAEIAILVRSDLKGHGIGWEMLRESCDYARARGLRRVECLEASSNERAISLEREQGFKSRFHPDSAELTIVTRNLD